MTDPFIQYDFEYAGFKCRTYRVPLHTVYRAYDSGLNAFYTTTERCYFWRCMCWSDEFVYKGARMPMRVDAQQDVLNYINFIIDARL